MAKLISGASAPKDVLTESKDIRDNKDCKDKRKSELAANTNHSTPLV